MVKYICDKCGEHVYRAAMTVMTLEKHDLNEVTVEEYHFCPECINKLTEWIEEGDAIR
jgi:hypothetical protein